jgi:hypothetical protein
LTADVRVVPTRRDAIALLEGDAFLRLRVSEVARDSMAKPERRKDAALAPSDAPVHVTDSPLQVLHSFRYSYDLKRHAGYEQGVRRQVLPGPGSALGGPAQHRRELVRSQIEPTCGRALRTELKLRPYVCGPLADSLIAASATSEGL